MKIIFHHVPKAAGSTFSASLYCHYRPDEVFRVGGKKKNERLTILEQLNKGRRKRLRAILSHMPFGAHRIVGEECLYYSIVRDPVKRATSLYRYILSEPSHYLNSHCIKSGSIIEFVNHPQANEMRNEMTRYFLYPEQMDTDETVHDHHLALAIENIENHFPSVGLLERYDESIVLFGSIYQHKPLYYLRLNKTTGAAHPLSDSEIQALSKANSIDIKLYDYLRERFERQLGATQINVPVDIDRFKLRNRIYGKALFLIRVFIFKLREKLTLGR